MAAEFVYLLFLSVLLFIIIAGGYSYFFHKKIKNYKVNPINVILGGVLLIGLWLLDLTTLDLSIKGIMQTYGVAPDATRVPGLFIWGMSALAMLSVTIYYYIVNEKYNKNSSSKMYNRLLVYTLFLGWFVMVIGGLYMMIVGYNSRIFGIFSEGLYHSGLPLVIISVLALMVDTK